MRIRIVDAFTDRPFAGNQLAVVHGAGDLSTDQCLTLAREFDYAETTFPVPAASGTVRSRAGSRWGSSSSL